jgi:uncharacterized membrane protein YeiH
VNIIAALDIVGTVAFAVSGVLTAMNKRLDPFGIFIIAFVAAVGGGTLRDILIKAPITWMEDLIYIHLIMGTTIVTVIFRNKLNYFRRSLLLSDTLGMVVFTLVGLEKGLDAGYSPIICITLGTMTACFGGVIRDTLSNKIPIIFHKEIYATACILGGITYFVMTQFDFSNGIILIVSGSVIIVVRLLAIYFNFSLPNVYSKEEIEDNQKY